MLENIRYLLDVRENVLNIFSLENSTSEPTPEPTPNPPVFYTPTHLNKQEREVGYLQSKYLHLNWVKILWMKLEMKKII